MLLEVQHETTISSPADAEALFRALRVRVVSLRHLRPTSGQELSAVLSCFGEKGEHTLSFEGGSLDAAKEALRTLVLTAYAPQPFGYFDLRTRAANLRIWPRRHSTTRLDKVIPQKGQIESAKAPCWVERIGNETLYPGTLEEAYRCFMDAASDDIRRGFFNGITEHGRRPCQQFVLDAGATPEARGEVPTPDARRLTELCGENAEWQAEYTSVFFPAGTIKGWFSGDRNNAKTVAKWHRRIDAARAAANLSG